MKACGTVEMAVADVEAAEIGWDRWGTWTDDDRETSADGTTWTRALLTRTRS